MSLLPISQKVVNNIFVLSWFLLKLGISPDFKMGSVVMVIFKLLYINLLLIRRRLLYNDIGKHSYFKVKSYGIFLY